MIIDSGRSTSSAHDDKAHHDKTGAQRTGP